MFDWGILVKAKSTIISILQSFVLYQVHLLLILSFYLSSNFLDEMYQFLLFNVKFIFIV